MYPKWICIPELLCVCVLHSGVYYLFGFFDWIDLNINYGSRNALCIIPYNWLSYVVFAAEKETKNCVSGFMCEIQRKLWRVFFEFIVVWIKLCFGNEANVNCTGQKVATSYWIYWIVRCVVLLLLLVPFLFDVRNVQSIRHGPGHNGEQSTPSITIFI